MSNRATLGVYELGSTFKTITLAMGMDLGVIRSMGQRSDATAPLKIGRFRINDDHPLNRWLSIPETLLHSSNLSTARIADEIALEPQRASGRQSVCKGTRESDRVDTGGRRII